MTIGEFLSNAVVELRHAGFTEPANEGHYLVAGILNLSRTQVMVDDRRSIDTSDLEKLNQALKRRLTGEPLAYIVGYRDFYNLRFLVRPGVLVPRPETEHLVEAALELYGPDFSGRILDIGCGSGCIGLSLLKEWPKATLVAVDSEEVPAAVTLENAAVLGLEDRIKVERSTFIEFAKPKAGQFDLIVANPPYIANEDADVQASVRQHEPSTALFAADEGLFLIWQWLREGQALLRPAGYFLMEIGATQSPVLSRKFNEQVPQVTLVGFRKDLAGVNRVLICRHN